MKIYLYAILIFYATTVNATMVCDASYGYTIEKDGKTYCQSKNGYKNYWSAEAWCDAIGGILVSVDSAGCDEMGAGWGCEPCIDEGVIEPFAVEPVSDDPDSCEINGGYCFFAMTGDSCVLTSNTINEMHVWTSTVYVKGLSNHNTVNFTLDLHREDTESTSWSTSGTPYSALCVDK